MKKRANMLAITALIVFCLIQIYDFRVSDIYDLVTDTFGERYLKIAKKQGFSQIEACKFLLDTGRAVKIHEKIHGNHKYNILDIFEGVENECKEIIESYKKEEKTKSTII